MKFGKILASTIANSSDNETLLNLSANDYINYKRLKRTIKDAPETFLSILDSEVGKVNLKYNMAGGNLSLKYSSLEQKSKRANANEDIASQVDAHRTAIMALKEFATINATAVEKILKKYDKKTHNSVKETYLAKVAELQFYHTSSLSNLLQKSITLQQQQKSDETSTLRSRRNKKSTEEPIKYNGGHYTVSEDTGILVSENILPVVFCAIAATFVLGVYSPFAGFICFSCMFLTALWKKLRRTMNIPAHPKTSQATLIMLAPTNILSRTWGIVNNIPLPVALRKPLYMLWAVLFQCNLDEMRFPLESYTSLCEFFSRPLKEGVRPIAPRGLASPVDARVVSCGAVSEDGTLEQIKGVSYSLKHFLGEDDSKKDDSSSLEGKKLYHIVLYLAPGDYHRIHAPHDLKINERRHFPGALLPVGALSVKLVRGLFAINERVVLKGEWSEGFFSLTAVGAFNVGSVALAFDKEVNTNNQWVPMLSKQDPYHTPGSAYARKYPNGIVVEKGEDIAHFRLGSTVVLVFESPRDFEFTVKPGQKVSVGQKLGDICKPRSRRRVVASTSAAQTCRPLNPHNSTISEISSEM